MNWLPRAMHAPHVAASAIREYLAFYPDRVDAIEIDSEG